MQEAATVTVALSVLRAMRVLNLNQTPKMIIRKSKLFPKLVLSRLSRPEVVTCGTSRWLSVYPEP